MTRRVTFRAFLIGWRWGGVVLRYLWDRTIEVADDRA